MEFVQTLQTVLFVLAVLFVLISALFFCEWLFMRKVLGKPKKLDETDPEALRDTAWGLCAEELVQAIQRVRSRYAIRTLTAKGFDGEELHADWISCGKPTGRVVILFHGWHGSQYADFGLILEHYLEDLRADVLLVEQRAHGKSTVRYTGFGFWEQHDCVTWAEVVVRQCGRGVRILLEGISMGATTVMLASAFALPNVRGIVADCGFTSAWEEFAYILRRNHLPKFPFLPVANCLCLWMAHYGLREGCTTESLAQARLPMLFLHGEADRLVPCEMTRRNFEVCASEDKQMILVPGAGHGQSYPMDRARVLEALDDFVDRIGL